MSSEADPVRITGGETGIAPAMTESSTATELPTATDRRLDCVRIAREAGALLRERFGRPGEVKDKGDIRERYDVVTEVDVLSEQLVLGRIAELAPSSYVLAEEGGLTGSDGVTIDLDPASADELWIVDPLDGTINFAYEIPHFGVSIACWRRGRPVAGCILDPMVGEEFSFEWPEHGEDGESAAFHGERHLHLDESITPGVSIVYLGSSAYRMPDIVGQFRGTRQLASAALALAWTAAGRCGAYIQPGGLQPWDWAVGAPLVQAAGGTVTDAGGRDWSAALDAATGIIAAAPGVHEPVAAALADA